MKKTLSLFLAFLMLFSSFSFVHAETQAEQNEAITFEDVLAGVATLEEYNATRTKADIIGGPGDDGASFPAGTYYLNNKSSSGFLRNSSSSLSTESGLIANLGNSIRWVVTSAGKDNYIRSASDSTKYLGVPANSSSSAVELVTVTSGSSVPQRCRWTIHIAAAGDSSSPSGIHIKNKHNSRYLMASGASVSTNASVGSGIIEKEKRIWRAASTSYYSNGSSTTKRELTANTSIKNIEIASGASGAIVVNKYYSNEIWALPSDFTYTFSKSGMASLSGGQIKGASGKYGGVTLTATHKVTGRKKNFYVLLGFSTTLSSTPKPIYDNEKDHNQWPAEEDTMFYGWPYFARRAALDIKWDAAQLLIAGGYLFGKPLAASCMEHFLYGTGTKYTIDFKNAISSNTTPKTNRITDMNTLISAIEVSADSSEKTIRTIAAIPHGDGVGDWHFAINEYLVTITCKYRKIGNMFTANVTYQMHDFYDWDNKDEEVVYTISPRELWELHYGGYARNFEVYGKNTFTMTWTQGQTFSNGVTISNEN